MICLGYDETFCLNAIEANACGLPVITFCETVLKDIIKNNYNGSIVKNYKSLSNKILELINNDQLTKNKYINNSIKSSKKYHFNMIKKKWVMLFNTK